MVVDHLATFAARHAPGFELPSVFAGFPVGADVRADLGLHPRAAPPADVSEIADTNIEARFGHCPARRRRARGPTRSSRTASPRRSLRFGPFDDNALLRASERRATREPRDRVRLDIVDRASRPRTTCELRDRAHSVRGRARSARTRRSTRRCSPTCWPALGGSSAPTRPGFIDDSEDGDGARYDIYSADVYLFTEPFADDLEPLWSRGARARWAVSSTAVATTRRIGHAVGSIARRARRVPHDRVGCARARPRAHRRRGTLARTGPERLDQFPAWSDGALLTAHTRRSQNTYRGPDRWLQLTFDCLGKLAWAARAVRVGGAQCNAGESVEPFTPRGRARALRTRTAHARCGPTVSPAIAFVLPFVGPAWADYLPAPRNPGSTRYPSMHRCRPSYRRSRPAVTVTSPAAYPSSCTHDDGAGDAADGRGFPPSRPARRPNHLEDGAPRMPHGSTAMSCASTRHWTSTRFHSR